MPSIPATNSFRVNHPCIQYNKILAMNNEIHETESKIHEKCKHKNHKIHLSDL